MQRYIETFEIMNEKLKSLPSLNTQLKQEQEAMSMAAKQDKASSQRLVSYLLMIIVILKKANKLSCKSWLLVIQSNALLFVLFFLNMQNVSI